MTTVYVLEDSELPRYLRFPVCDTESIEHHRNLSKYFVSIKQLVKTGEFVSVGRMAALVYTKQEFDPSTLQVEAGQSRFQGHLGYVLSPTSA